MADNLYDVLEARGLIAQSTDADIRDRLSSPLTAYIGFDPTADSLHVGSLVPVMALAWLQLCGHRPLALVGGATGLVGDPSGKTEARKMLTRDDVNHNVACIGEQIGRVVQFGDGANDATLVNNADWLADRTWIEVLREWGPHFSVNRMLTMDSVKGRMESGGISFLEFNYMVMQAADFAYLYKEQNCTLQMGGQDQWGNIVMGIELGRRLHQAPLAGLTMPLITKADGGKFGKSEAGNVWLSKDRTPVFEFFQFWRNIADADVKRFLGFFTFLPMSEIEAMTAEGGKALNDAKEVLAFEVTKMIHGEDAANASRADAKKAFSGQADVTGDQIPHGDISGADLEEGQGILTLLVKAGLAKSNGEARRLVQGKGVRLHDTVVADPTHTITSADIVDNYVLIRAGKKRMYRFDVVS